MKLTKKNVKMAALAMFAVAFTSSAQAAFVVEQSGGVITAMNGFDFGGQTYNISLSEADYAATTSVKFDDVTASGFVSALAAALNTAAPAAEFTSMPGTESFGLVASDTNNTYFADVKYNGHSYVADTYGPGSYNWVVGLDKATGMNISAVPLPAAVYMFGAGIIGFFAANRRKNGLAEASAA